MQSYSPFALLLWLSALKSSIQIEWNDSCTPCLCYIGTSCLDGGPVRTADCSDEKVDGIPQHLPVSIRHLDMRGCALDTISASSLAKYQNLDSLFLDCNNITTINNETFPNQYGLKVLSLSGNTITRLTKDSFINVPNLVKIEGIASNQFDQGTFSNLPSLTEINVHALAVKPNDFLDSASLRTLTLEVKASKTISPSIFGNSDKTLNTLTIISDSLEALPYDLLHNMTSLRKFNLIAHMLQRLPESFFGKSIHTSSKTNSSFCYITHIYITGVHRITGNLFCNQPNVYELTIFGSIEIESLAFRTLWRIYVLNLSHNNIEHIDPMWFSHMTGLKTLSLSFNKLTSIDSETLSGLRMLEKLDLSHNNLIIIDVNTFKTIRSTLNVLNLSSNNIMDLANSTFTKMFSLKELDMSCNKLTEIDENLLSDLYGITDLKINNNHLSKLQKRNFDALSNLKHLNLSGNMIDTLPNGVFSQLPVIKELDLSENLLTNLPQNIIREDAKLDSMFLEQKSGVLFSCDCGMLSMYSRTGWPLEFNGHCGYPPDVKGLAINALNVSELCIEELVTTTQRLTTEQEQEQETTLEITTYTEELVVNLTQTQSNEIVTITTSIYNTSATLNNSISNITEVFPAGKAELYLDKQTSLNILYVFIALSVIPVVGTAIWSIAYMRGCVCKRTYLVQEDIIY